MVDFYTAIPTTELSTELKYFLLRFRHSHDVPLSSPSAPPSFDPFIFFCRSLASLASNMAFLFSLIFSRFVLWSVVWTRQKIRKWLAPFTVFLLKGWNNFILKINWLFCHLLEAILWNVQSEYPYISPLIQALWYFLKFISQSIPEELTF